MVDDVMAESTGDVCMIIYLFFYLNPNIFIAGTHARYHSVLSRCTRKPTPPGLELTNVVSRALVGYIFVTPDLHG